MKLRKNENGKFVKLDEAKGFKEIMNDKDFDGKFRNKKIQTYMVNKNNETGLFYTNGVSPKYSKTDSGKIMMETSKSPIVEIYKGFLITIGKNSKGEATNQQKKNIDMYLKDGIERTIVDILDITDPPNKK